MDDLDRLYHQLVDSMRRQRPTALLEPCTVLEVHEHLVPYRRVRNALGFRSNEDYEATLSRMLSGERGYLLGEGDLQPELQVGLGEIVADIRRYRSYPEARVWLNPEKIPPPGDIRYAPPEVRERTDWARAIAADEAMAPDSEETQPINHPTADPGASAPPEAVSVDDATSVEDPAAAESEDVAMDRAAPAATRTCRRCTEQLPEGALFCPFCGSPMSGQCRSCGAEMDRAWRYCAACGEPRV
jgi:hypothetical protein